VALVRTKAAVTTRRRKTMADHKTGTREEWLASRLGLLKEEKEPHHER
jgi:predicted dithiol-disulfide oxidoreductase (DUF899 family)